MGSAEIVFWFLLTPPSTSGRRIKPGNTAVHMPVYKIFFLFFLELCEFCFPYFYARSWHNTLRAWAAGAQRKQLRKQSAAYRDSIVDGQN